MSVILPDWSNRMDPVQITDLLTRYRLVRFDRKVIEKLARGCLWSNVPLYTMNQPHSSEMRIQVKED